MNIAEKLDLDAPVGAKGNRIKVVVVDDSALMRSLLTDILTRDPGIDVVATANDAYDAREKIKRFDPDVITLDVEMPGMDGIQFLRNLMRLRPMPVVMVSSQTQRGARVTLEALEIGAVEYVPKPRGADTQAYEDYARAVVTKVRIAGQARVKSYSRSALKESDAAQSSDPATQEDESFRFSKTVADRVIAIGSSTGGTEALKTLLAGFPAQCPPVVISQHIPAAFSKSFADRLDSLCKPTVRQAVEGDEIKGGHIYIAPGDVHLTVVKRHGKLFCHLDDGPAVNCHKPSVGALFDSVRNALGRKAVAIMLTGMGDDGAREMKTLHDEGAFTIAQDEETSVVWGMPGQAVKRGAVDEVLPLDKIAEKALSRVCML